MRIPRFCSGLAGALAAALASVAEASITLCNGSGSTLEYVMVRNDWAFGSNFMPSQVWYIDGWYELPPGCSTVIDEQKLLVAYFLIQEWTGKRWRPLRFPIEDIGYAQGSSGTDYQFCIHEAKLWRRAQSLDELAVCSAGQRLETFSVYVRSDADTQFTLRLK